jgi:uncharacterized protein YdeI (YjbR/CyaY-like superfamily)
MAIRRWQSTGLTIPHGVGAKCQILSTSGTSHRRSLHFLGSESGRYDTLREFYSFVSSFHPHAKVNGNAVVTDHKGLPILSFASRAAWESWLDENGAVVTGVWLKFAKKTSGVACIGKTVAIEVALARGWIDGQLDKFDDAFWLVRFTPRGPRSKWSQMNCATADTLIAAGRMTAAGLAEVEKARRDGRWDAAYAPQSRAEIPDDLAAALNAQPQAKAFFATLRGANRYAVLYRIHDAKSAKTRAARIEKFVAMLARGETVHPVGGLIGGEPPSQE